MASSTTQWLRRAACCRTPQRQHLVDRRRVGGAEVQRVRDSQACRRRWGGHGHAYCHHHCAEAPRQPALRSHHAPTPLRWPPPRSSLQVALTVSRRPGAKRCAADVARPRAGTALAANAAALDQHARRCGHHVAAERMPEQAGRRACSPEGRGDGGRWRPVKHRRTARRRVCRSTREMRSVPAAVQAMAQLDAGEPEVAAGQHAGFVLADHLAVPAEATPRPQRPAPVDAGELVAGLDRRSPPLSLPASACSSVSAFSGGRGRPTAACARHRLAHWPGLRFEAHADQRGPLGSRWPVRRPTKTSPRHGPSQRSQGARCSRHADAANRRQAARGRRRRGSGCRRGPGPSGAARPRHTARCCSSDPTGLAALEVQRRVAHRRARPRPDAADRRPVEQPEIERAHRCGRPAAGPAGDAARRRATRLAKETTRAWTPGGGGIDQRRRRAVRSRSRASSSVGPAAATPAASAAAMTKGSVRDEALHATGARPAERDGHGPRAKVIRRPGGERAIGKRGARQRVEPGQRAARRRCGSMAGRSAPSGRRSRSTRAAPRRATRTWRCRHSRRAVSSCR